MQLDFAGVCEWIDGHLGRRMFAATQGASENTGNTRLTVRGRLERAEGEVVLIDAPPGRVEVYAVGDGTLVLLEGEFVAAALAQLGEGRPTLVEAEFRDLIVVVGEDLTG